MPERTFNIRKPLSVKGTEVPYHAVIAGKHTTTANVTQTITVAGLQATDVVSVTVQTKGATPRTIVRATPTANTLTVEMSGDPSTDHVLAYVAHRNIQ